MPAKCACAELAIGIVLGVAGVMVGAVSAAQAEILYTHGQEAPPVGGTWVPSTIWAMADSGSDPHQLIAASDVASSQQSLCCVSLSPNSTAALFDGFDYQYSGVAAGGYGDYYEGIYVLANGAYTRLSPAPSSAPGQSSYETPAVLTSNGNVIYQFQGVTYSGSPPGVTAATWRMDEVPDTGGSSTNWQWVGDNGDNNSTDGFAASYPPSSFASDPNSPAMLAYALNGNLYIAGNGTTGTTVASQPDAYANGGIGWSPDGTELVDVDGGSGSPGLWLYAASANSTGRQVIASTSSSGQFSDPVFVGQNEIAFEAENNIWEVSAACSSCSFPADATQLTTDGTATAPDAYPAWTSQTVTVPGGTKPKPKPKVTVSLSVPGHQHPIKNKELSVVVALLGRSLLRMGAVANVEVAERPFARRIVPGQLQHLPAEAGRRGEDPDQTLQGPAQAVEGGAQEARGRFTLLIIEGADERLRQRRGRDLRQAS